MCVGRSAWARRGCATATTTAETGATSYRAIVRLARPDSSSVHKCVTAFHAPRSATACATASTAQMNCRHTVSSARLSSTTVAFITICRVYFASLTQRKQNQLALVGLLFSRSLAAVVCHKANGSVVCTTYCIAGVSKRERNTGWYHSKQCGIAIKLRTIAAENCENRISASWVWFKCDPSAVWVRYRTVWSGISSYCVLALTRSRCAVSTT